MQYTDSSFLMMLFILPSLFGLALIGEGIQKIMNYDGRGWIGVGAGAAFVIIILLAYLMISTKTIG